MLKYKDYTAIVEFDDEADIFHGEVINIADIITFQGKSTNELRLAFKDSIEDYLEFCTKQGQAPQKPFSGKMLIRTTPGNHRKIAEAAAISKMSINQWVEQNLVIAAQNNNI